MKNLSKNKIINNVNNLISNLNRFLAFIAKNLTSIRWLISTNHKEIGLLYFAFGVVMGILGALLSWVIRMELAFPGSWYLNGNYELFNAIVTAHAIVMIFFSERPLLFSEFGNCFIPIMCETTDMAFPKLNILGFG